jgi:hypothetical protein
MFNRGGNLAASVCIPDADKPIVSGGCNQPAIGTEGGVIYLAIVIPERAELLGYHRIPDTHQTVIAHRQYVVTIRAKRGQPNGVAVDQCRAESNTRTRVP